MKKQMHMKRKIGYTATSLILAGVSSMTTLHTTAQAADTPTSMATDAPSNKKVPTPKLIRTIDLSNIGSAVAIRKLSFSPDSRFLAIVVDPELGKTDIVVWDMEKAKRQSHIHCPYQYGVLADHDLLWSRDGKVISFGAKRQWDPMTGEALPDNPAIGRAARLNKNGTRMLTIVGAIGQPSYIHIYDTATWTLQKMYVDGLAVETASWTAEDKILAGVHPTKETIRKTFDKFIITNGFDVGLRLLDPTGRNIPKAVWFPSVPDDRPKYAPMKQAISVDLSMTNFKSNFIALGANRLVNGESLEIVTYYTLDELQSHATAGGGGKAFSADGQLLFIKDVKPIGSREAVSNAIIDVSTGKQVLRFPGGSYVGIASSPDGKLLALGDSHGVQIDSIQ